MSKSPYEIIGVRQDGSEQAVASGYQSRHHAFASATKRTIDLRHCGNPDAFLRLTLKDASGTVVPEYDGDQMLDLALPSNKDSQ